MRCQIMKFPFENPNVHYSQIHVVDVRPGELYERMMGCIRLVHDTMPKQRLQRPKVRIYQHRNGEDKVWNWVLRFFGN